MRSVKPFYQPPPPITEVEDELATPEELLADKELVCKGGIFLSQEAFRTYFPEGDFIAPKCSAENGRLAKEFLAASVSFGKVDWDFNKERMEEEMLEKERLDNANQIHNEINMKKETQDKIDILVLRREKLNADRVIAKGILSGLPRDVEGERGEGFRVNRNALHGEIKRLKAERKKCTARIAHLNPNPELKITSIDLAEKIYAELNDHLVTNSKLGFNFVRIIGKVIKKHQA